MNKLFDLRFAIGLFFVIIGTLLGIHSLVRSIGDLNNVNTWCSLSYLLFGGSMLLFGGQSRSEK